MYQLVGLAGQRYYVAIRLTQFLALAAFGAFFFLVLYHYGGQLQAIAWPDLTMFDAAGVFVTLSTGLQARSKWGDAIRLGFSPSWWSTPSALGLAFLGSAITLLLFATSDTVASALSADTLVRYLPAVLGWGGALLLLGLVTAKDVLRLKTAGAQAHTRRTALAEVAGHFAEGQLERVRTTCDADAHLLTNTVLPSPKGRPLYGLAAKPWYETAEFPWAVDMERQFEAIRAEALDVLKDGSGFHTYAYPGVNQGGWSSFSFVSQGQENTANLQRCPKTAELLRRIPRYPHFRDAMFSLLEPHAEIPHHQDYHNVYLTCHLGLLIPPDASIQVAGVERPWQAGKCLIFDSSFSHSAYNHSDERRLVLLVDFMHPDVNDAELAWLQRVGLA